MLNDVDFVQQTLTSNLYYLRTLREFATNIQLSFLQDNKMYIDTARDFGKRCEELGRILMKYANGNIPKEALDNNILVTDYTLDTELLTEKLFNIDIDTNITQSELSLTAGMPINPSKEMLNELDSVNRRALIIVTNFINFCEDIVSRMNNNELFSYSYISIIRAMLVEMNLYRTTLTRLIARESIDPGYVVNYEYLFNNLLQRLSSFIRGLTDPSNDVVIIRAGAFSNEFGVLANEYKESIASPDNKRDLEERTIDALDRFRVFVSDIIEDVLNSRIYFIVEPVFLDNILTTTNYFKYILLEDE